MSFMSGFRPSKKFQWIKPSTSQRIQDTNDEPVRRMQYDMCSFFDATWFCWHRWMLYISPVCLIHWNYAKWLDFVSDSFLNIAPFHSWCVREIEMIYSGSLVSHEIYDCGFGLRLHLRAQNEQRGESTWRACLNCMLKETNKMKPQHPGHVVSLVAPLHSEWKRDLFHGDKCSLKSTAVWC